MKDNNEILKIYKQNKLHLLSIEEKVQLCNLLEEKGYHNGN